MKKNATTFLVCLFFILAILGFLSSCVPSGNLQEENGRLITVTPAPSDSKGEYLEKDFLGSIRIVHDYQRGNICYVYSATNQGGISCMKEVSH